MLASLIGPVTGLLDKVIEDKDLLKQVTLNSKKLVNERYNTNLFFKTLEKIIEYN